MIAAVLWIPAVNLGFYYVLFFRTDLLIPYLEVFAVLILSLFGISAWRVRLENKKND